MPHATRNMLRLATCNGHGCHRIEHPFKITACRIGVHGLWLGYGWAVAGPWLGRGWAVAGPWLGRGWAVDIRCALWTGVASLALLASLCSCVAAKMLPKKYKKKYKRFPCAATDLDQWIDTQAPVLDF